jgi:uncharacterized protein YfiM (DUF2279 family)
MKTRIKQAAISFMLMAASFSMLQAQTNDSLPDIRFWDTPDRYIPARGKLAGLGISGSYLIGMSFLYSTWYRDYPQSTFHFFNDGAEWKQMDKAGHFGSGYYLSRWGSGIFRWTGLPKRRADIYGVLSAFTFMTTIEVFDGFSRDWGFSDLDFVANTSGIGLFIGQQLLWKEQRISVKFSYQDDPVASYRPDVLGSSLPERVLKNYNGQTYWLSFNLASFHSTSKLPPWLNLALGYGAGGMVSSSPGSSELVNDAGFTPYRQVYLSPDIEWSKIPTNSGFLRTFFKVIDFIKVPAPALEFREGGRWLVHGLYF